MCQPARLGTHDHGHMVRANGSACRFPCTVVVQNDTIVHRLTNGGCDPAGGLDPTRGCDECNAAAVQASAASLCVSKEWVCVCMCV